MSAWKEYKFSEIMDIIGGGTPKTTKPEFWNGSIPWLSVVDFADNNKYVSRTEKTISKSGLTNSSTKILKAGQIIISARGTVGELAMLSKDMAFNQSCYGLDAKPDLCSNVFLYYLLKIKIKELKRNAHGAVFDTITRNTFDTIKVKIPNLHNQTAIAEILSSLDDKIELNNLINRNLEDLAQAFFKHWFVDFEFPNENGQPYKSSGGEMLESELGLIPEGWRVTKISEVSNLRIGRTPPRMEHQWFSTNEDDVKWVSIKDMGISGVYITETNEFLTEDAIAKFNIPVINPNTVILSFKLTVGRLAITTERMLSNEAIAHINLSTSDFYTEFIYLYLKLFNYESLGSTSSIATAVNSKSIQSIPVIFPDIKILDRFKSAICIIFKGILNTTQENIDLKKLRDTLLPKLISGELEVKEALEQTENVL